jgi:hypothetical protein
MPKSLTDYYIFNLNKWHINKKCISPLFIIQNYKILITIINCIYINKIIIS